jgi:multiple sugar transport system permease protein
MRRIVPWLFLAPALLVFATFKFVPMLKGLELSFYKVNFTQEHEWVGGANFARAMGDGALHAAAINTTIYVVVTVFASAILAFLLALVLQGPARHLRILRTAMFLPAITSAAIVAEVWRILFFPTADGVVNGALGWAGIEAQGFLTDPRQALGTLMLLHMWKAIPYDMVIFVAGLATINQELYEAAEMDGANRLQKLLHVTLPSMMPTIAIVLMLGFIRGFRVFAEVYATTGGGPAGATEMIMTHIYKIGFDQFDYGYASAVSFLLFLFTVTFTVAYLAWQRRIQR